MPAVASSSNLVELIQKLETQNNQHAQSAAAVASTLEQIGRLLGSLVGGARSSMPPVAPKPAIAAKATKAATTPVAAKTRTRQKFAVTGEQSVLAFVRRKGNPTTADVHAHWKSEGRGASADNVLTKLFKEKKVKREPIKNGRGSRYSLA